MTTGLLAIGGAVLGFLYPFAAVEIWDAYRYRDHPTTNLRAEIKAWAGILGLWTLAVAAVAYSEGYL
jgi:hypothetical protein